MWLCSVGCTGHCCNPGNRSELKLASSRGQDAIRHVFSKDMHMQLFSGMQVLSGGLAGKGWADHDARLYTVVTEELMGVSHTIHE